VAVGRAKEAATGRAAARRPSDRVARAAPPAQPPGGGCEPPRGRRARDEQAHGEQVRPEPPGPPAGGGERLGGDLRGVEVQRLAEALDVADDGAVAGVQLPGPKQGHRASPWAPRAVAAWAQFQ